jgi:hypothetical protein
MVALGAVAPHAALAMGALSGGRALAGIIRGVRGRNKTFDDSKRGKGLRSGFWRNAARNQAVHDATSAALHKEAEAQKWRNEIDKIDELERTRGATGLTGAEKTDRDKLRKKVEKYENAGKKKDD